MNSPWPRRFTQVLGLLAIVAAPLVSLWGVGTARVWSPAELRMRYGPLAPAAQALLRNTLGDPPEGAVQAVVGGTWSFSLFGLELADPLAVLSLAAAGALTGAAASLVVGALLVAALHLLAGRAFCGWLCPYGTASRLVARLRRPLARRGLVLDLRPPTWIRYGLLVAVVGAPLAGLSLAPWLLPYLATTRLPHALLFGGLAGVAGPVAALLLSDLLLWDHGVCRSLCPSGAWQRELGRLRVLRLVARPSRPCTKGCDACDAACWLGLDPRGGTPGPDCDACGRCAGVCPTGRLAVGLRAPRRRPGRRSRARGAAAALLGLGLFARGCGGEAPQVVVLTPGVSTPFAPPAEGLAIDATAGAELGSGAAWAPGAFVEKEGPQGVVSVGSARTADGRTWLRVFLEAAPGEPWRGPLDLVVVNAAGSAPLHLAGPREPRSTPRPSLYEAALTGAHPMRVRFENGPAEGVTVEIPEPGRGEAAALGAALAPSLAVAVVWLLGLGLRRRPGTDGACAPSVE